MFHSEFGTLITAMITPFTVDNNIDFQALEKLIDHLLKSGSTALLISGTTGENPTLTHEEEQQLLKSCREIVNGKVPIIFGAGSNCTATAIQSCRRAQELGADAVMIVSPYYNKPNQEGIYAHFAAIAYSCKLPIMLYNNPARTCSYIEPETVVRLAKAHTQIQALKESRSENSLDSISHINQAVPEFSIYSGDDNLILPVLVMGGAGLVSVASHIVGTQLAELIDLTQTCNYNKSLKIFQKLQPLLKVLFCSPSPGPVKYLLNKLGICNPGVRLPLTEPSAEQKIILESALNEVSKSQQLISN